MRKLPASTSSWMCPYFVLIMYLSIYLIAAALLNKHIPDAMAAVGSFSLGAAFAMRNSEEGQACLAAHREDQQ